jgi:acyl-CoA reductase-like NAD-dependent aldehyde dehydrogenase
MSHYKMLIGGQLVDSDRSLEVINPATEEPFATVARASQEDADRAIAAAANAFPSWAETPIEKRSMMIAKLADQIAANSEQIARALTQEQGKPLAEAAGEIAWAEGYLRHYAQLDVAGRIIQDDDAGFVEVRRKPLGVVAGIIAWNFPLLVACWKIGPALMAGNTIVLKPAPTTPVTALILAEICSEIFPAGVVNVIVDDNDLGEFLTTDPRIAKIGFTGSTATGKKIMASAASSLKRLTLELGGNDPGIVLDDVDVPSAAQGIFNAAFLNCGQVCLAVKRAYVHDSIYDEMCDELARLADAAIVDDGLSQGAQIGPIQNRTQFDKLRGMIENAGKDGVIIAGGERVDRPGYFIRPTIVRDVTDGDQIVDEEQFGPILPVVRYSDVDDVIARANASPYGLGASVWSSNVDRATAIASRIDSGSVWVNQHIAIGPHIPMAGSKSSGIGVEQAEEGLAEYSQISVINIAR